MYPDDIDPESGCRLPLPRREELNAEAQAVYQALLANAQPTEVVKLAAGYYGLAAIYLAKIWVGAFLGRILLKPSGTTKSDWLLGLLVGLLILTIVRFIPYLGGLVHLGVVCLGLGAFAGQLYRASRPVMTA